MLKQMTKPHSRVTTLVYDPEQVAKKSIAYTIQKKRRVAAYARVSTEQEEQQNSYEAQVSYYTDYIQSRLDWEFVKVYADEGITGTSTRSRTGFNEMIQDALAGRIDMILTKSISRFARNTVDALEVTRKLKAANVEVFFEKENISNMDTQAEMVFTMLSSIAQEESRSISENVRWGQRRSMEAGKVSLPYKSFLGYEKGPDGLPQIVEEEAKIVRFIYKAYLEGDTFVEIAERLTRDGVPTPKGRKVWSSQTVRSILTNEKYKGDARLQKTYTVDFLTKEKRVNNGEVRQWYVKDSHDAIVSAATFDLVQKEIERRCARRGKFYDSPFTMKIFCGVCGGYYGHRVWHSNEKYRKNVWICNDKYKDGSVCRTPKLTDEEIQNAFLMAVRERFPDPGAYCDEFERDRLPKIGDTRRLAKKLEKLNDEFDAVAKEIDTLLAESIRTHRVAEYRPRIEDLGKQAEALNREIDALEARITGETARQAACGIFLEGLRKHGSKMFRFDVKAWHALVEYVEVMPNKTLVFHFRNGEKHAVGLEKVH